MRLSDLQRQQVEDFSGSNAIPDDDPNMSVLRRSFGDHTFFIDEEGLHIWEAVDDDPRDGAKLVGVRIASWSGGKKQELVPHDPAPSQVFDPDTLKEN